MNRMSLAAMLALIVGFPLSAQSHPGIQQKIDRGCDSPYFDEVNMTWTCGSGPGGLNAAVGTCDTARCPDFCGFRNPQGKLGPSQCGAGPGKCEDNGNNCTCKAEAKHRPMPIAG